MMQKIKPLFEIVDIKESIVKREQKKIAAFQTKDINFFSANMLHLLPNIPTHRHQECYFDFMSYRALSVFQSEKPDTVAGLITTGNMEFMATVKNDPLIFCTYHLGSYRSLMGFLIRESIDFTLLVDERTHSEQGNSILQSFAAIKECFASDTTFSLLNVERPDSLITVFQHLKMGRSLVVYLDGNTGVGGIYNNNQSIFLELEFLGQPFRSRKGVALLAFLTNRPIIPAISYYADGEPPGTLQFEQPILPPVIRKNNKDSFVTATTQALYKILENKLREYPLQWEPWLYVHKFLDIPRLKQPPRSSAAITPATPLSFNHREFGLFKLDDQCFLFSKTSYEPWVIGDAAFSILSTLAEKEGFIPEDCDLSRESLDYLLKKNVLTPFQKQTTRQ